MLNWLIGLLASVSSIFTSGAANKANVAPPLNTAIIAYQETYYAPAVADLANFPRAKEISSEAQKTSVLPPTPAPLPIVVTPPPPIPTPPPTPVVTVITPPQDPYLAIPEPIVDWYIPVTFQRNSNSDSDYNIPEMTFNREYWRIEVLAYWNPRMSSGAPVENDYFKLEVYEKGTDKLIYTMISGNEKSIHKFQAFKKPGTYYFKAYLKSPSEFEITFTYH